MKHVKLSNFGLSTGFHKQHDSAYYQNLLDGDNSTSGTTVRSNRNSEAISSINSTVSTKDQITSGKQIVENWHFQQLVPQIISPLKSSFNKFIIKNVIFGAIMFECLVVYPPFCSPSAHKMYCKIIDWRHELYFPDDVHLSRESEDLIRRLITSADHRLEAPFVPHLKSVTDTSYFPTDDLGDVPNEPVGADTDSGSKVLGFSGYTFCRYKNSGGGEF
ncbi:hypothetical protein Pst134EB_021578 [Puccinia striiformis f. sp. tritici]|nr:hypothetical protein Pst134EB_021578 [Puccinia striiformis f. sp. tritici]